MTSIITAPIECSTHGQLDEVDVYRPASGRPVCKPCRRVLQAASRARVAGRAATSITTTAASSAAPSVKPARTVRVREFAPKPWDAGTRVEWLHRGTPRTGEVWATGPRLSSMTPVTVWVIPHERLEGEAHAVLVQLTRSGRRAGQATGGGVELDYLSSEKWQRALAAGYREVASGRQSVGHYESIHEAAQRVASDITRGAISAAA